MGTERMNGLLDALARHSTAPLALLPTPIHRLERFGHALGLPELWIKLASGLNTVATNRLLPATSIMLAPRRWFWASSQLDGTNRPFIAQPGTGPSNSFGTGANVASGAVTPLYATDTRMTPMMPTNLGSGTDEDRIIIDRPEEKYLFEGAVRTRVLFETKGDTLTAVFQLYNYAAFMADRRPNTTAVVAGTGLVAPTF